MKAVMLAAGLGSRLGKDGDFPRKVMLEFGGKSLLARHVRILRHLGVSELVMGVGYNAHMIDEEIRRIGAGDFVRTMTNPDYAEGAITTLWTLRDEIAAGAPILMMDGDVLYDHRLLARLIESPHADSLLFDREIEPGEEPVKICLAGGAIVDFHKQPTEPHDSYGEWVGFTRFSPEMAGRIPDYAAPYIERGETDRIYEIAIRDLLLDVPRGTFEIVEITGLPWIEIDFEEDVAKAEADILPALEEIG